MFNTAEGSLTTAVLHVRVATTVAVVAAVVAAAAGGGGGDVVATGGVGGGSPSRHWKQRPSAAARNGGLGTVAWCLRACTTHIVQNAAREHEPTA